MAAWLLPALKAVLPHVGTIISVAAPAFTKKKDEAGAPSPQLLQQQISELQAAASQNASNIKALAAQLQTTVAALEQAATIADAKLRRALWLCGAAAVLSVGALYWVLAVAGQ